jgi:predicted XRE-type DNA-binding protein
MAAEGGKADIAKPLQGLGSGAFQKKSTKGIKTPKREIDHQGPAEEAEGNTEMKREAKLDIVRGSGNVFRDLGLRNPDVEQFKSILATEIIKALDRQDLTVRAAQARTGIAAADFSRIRNADLGRFTLDRLMTILNRLGARIEVKVRVRHARAA